METFDPSDTREIKLFFQDEARFGRTCQPVRCWAPPGVRPCVPKQLIREYVNVYTAVCPWDGESFSLILPYTNYETMELFLQEFSSYYDEYRIVLVTDNAKWHPGEDYTPIDNIRIINQPSYSPQLNPVEHVWDYIRENHFRNQFFDSLSSVEDELVLALNGLLNEKDALQSLTGFHWTIFSI